MAVDYTIPPWLVPPKPEASAAAYVSALKAGADIAQQRQQLAMQAQKISMELQLKQEENERKSLIDEHKLATAQARSQAMLGLRSTQLEQSQQRIAMTAQKAARSFQFQQEYQRRVAAGEDPRKVGMELGPLISGSMAGMSGIFGGGSKSPAEYGGASEVPGLPGNYRQVQTGPATRRVINLGEPEEAGGAAPPQAVPWPGMPGVMAIPKSKRWTARSVPRPYESPEAKELREELATLKTARTRAAEGGFNTEATDKRIADTEKALEAARQAQGASAAPGGGASPALFEYDRETGTIRRKKGSGGGDLLDEEEEEFEEFEEDFDEEEEGEAY